jgi:YggT family protein
MLSVVIFIAAIIIRVVLNLLGKYFGPLSDLLADMTEPLLRPIRRIIPPLGVIDLSAYIAVILLIALNMVLTDLLPAVR